MRAEADPILIVSVFRVFSVDHGFALAVGPLKAMLYIETLLPDGRVGRLRMKQGKRTVRATVRVSVECC